MKILITGAFSHIGYETGLKLASLGHFVYLTVHHEKEVENLENRIKGKKNLKCFKLDITKEIDRKKILELDIDCLINNAAVGVGGSLLDISIPDLKYNFEVNVFSSLRLTQIYAADLFLKKKKGKIVFISSLAGILPISFLGSYCMTKASLIMLASVLRKELGYLSKDIKVKLIEPGIYNTGFNEVMIENKLNKKSQYFKDLEMITLRQKRLFNFIGKNRLTSVRDKIVKAILIDSNRFIYKVPLSQAIISKLYLLFK